MEEKVRLTVRISKELYNELMEIAEYRGAGNHIGLSRVVRDGLGEYVKDQRKFRKKWKEVGKMDDFD